MLPAKVLLHPAAKVVLFAVCLLPFAWLAYNTLQTILTRLTVKGLVERAERGRAHVYWPTKDEAASAAAQLRTTLSGVEDRAKVLREFASVLDADEARVLRDWLSGRTEVL